MGSTSRYAILAILALACAVNIALARNVTCNRFTDQYALNHTFLTGYLDVGIDDPITGLGFVFYSKVNAFTEEEISSAPTLVWLNGGPGSSSMEGAYFENGPYRVVSVNGSQIIEENPDSWTNKYNVLFIDQPIAVGFSRSANDSNLPTSEVEVASQFYKGLLSFYSQSGCYNSSIFLNSPLFISGESYAGKYIPNIAAEIISQNQNVSLTGNTLIPLVGISIGDPLIDPQHQLQQLAEFGLENNIISNLTAKAINLKIALMNKFFDLQNYEVASDIYNDAINYFMMHGINGPLDNVYNYKISRYPDDFVEDHCENYIKQFGFDQDFVYDSTSYLISESLSAETFQPNGIPALQFVLANNLPVFIYNGDNDILINTPGVTTFINSFSWAGNESFAQLQMRNLTATINGEEQVIGAYKSFENLYFATIADAGHLVPYDQPQSINIFLDSFITKVLRENNANSAQQQ